MHCDKDFMRFAMHCVGALAGDDGGSVGSSAPDALVPSINVPVREIMLGCLKPDGANADQYEVIDYEASLRLARQPGSHLAL